MNLEFITPAEYEYRELKGYLYLGSLGSKILGRNFTVTADCYCMNCYSQVYYDKCPNDECYNFGIKGIDAYLFDWSVKLVDRKCRGRTDKIS